LLNGTNPNNSFWLVPTSSIVYAHSLLLVLVFMIVGIYFHAEWSHDQSLAKDIVAVPIMIPIW
jgi:hypothetical protein